MPRIAALLVGALSTLVSVSAQAEPRVVLIQPEPNDAVLAEALHRLRGELRAVGFDVSTGPGPDHDPQWELEQASTPGTLVTITLRRSRDHDAVDVWVLDRLSGKTLIRRIHVPQDSPNAPTLLAVRTTELLRASLLEITVDTPVTSTPRPVMPPKVSRWMEPPQRELFATPTIQLGASLLFDPGLSVSVLPTLRVSHPVATPLAARLTLASTLSSNTESAMVANATIERQVMTAELAYALWSQRTVVGLVSAGAGVQRVGVTGAEPAQGYAVNQTSRWLFGLDIGAGAAIRLHKHFALVGDLHVLPTFPRANVYVGSDSIGRVGAPSWFGGLHGLLIL